jgi:hypothetical protein
MLIVHNLVVRFDSNIFFTKSYLTGTDNQYNKISEESDTAEDHVNSDTTNKFAPLNLESTHKWYVTNSILFKRKSISIKKLSSFLAILNQSTL